MPSPTERMLGGLLEASHLSGVEAMPELVAEHAGLIGFSETMIYVVDLQQRVLRPLPGQADAEGQELQEIPVDTTMAGLAFRAVTTVHARHTPFTVEERDESPEAGEPRRLWIPLLDGTERMGVLGATVPDEDETTEWQARQLAALVSLMLVSKRSTSDAYAHLVRAEHMAVSAEVLWNLMPPMSLATDRVVLSSVLEPAYEVGGDVFDYAFNGDLLYFSVFDAMGHDVSSGLAASIAVGASRGYRRQERGLVEISELIDEILAEQFEPARFVTGILAVLDTRTGMLAWVNRGHPPPLVLRQGRQVATLVSEAVPPMGLRLGVSAELCHYQLEPGDRVVFYTDGVIEARGTDGEVFGLDRFTDFLIRHEADELPAPETLRRLIQSILEHQSSRLQDDATVLLAEWMPGHPEEFKG